MYYYCSNNVVTLLNMKKLNLNQFLEFITELP